MENIEKAIKTLRRQNRRVAFDYINNKDVAVITLLCDEVEEAIKALEKQMSEKPNIQPFNDIMRKQKCYKVKCPKCGEKFFILEFINDKDRRFKEFGEWLNNCYNCGQKLNWGIEK